MQKNRPARSTKQMPAQQRRQRPPSNAVSTQSELSEFELDHFLPYLINRAGVTMATVFAMELRRDDLTLSMWRVLSVLSHLGPQSQVDLAVLTSIEESTMSRLVSTMDRNSLVTRRRSDVSSREVVIALTRKGHALTRRYIPIALAYEKIATRGINKTELETVRRCLRIMHTNLKGIDRGAS